LRDRGAAGIDGDDGELSRRRILVGADKQGTTLCSVQLEAAVNVWLRLVLPPLPAKFSVVAADDGLAIVLTTGEPGQVVAPGPRFCCTVTPPRAGRIAAARASIGGRSLGR